MCIKITTIDFRSQNFTIWVKRSKWFTLFFKHLVTDLTILHHLLGGIDFSCICEVTLFIFADHVYDPISSSSVLRPLGVSLYWLMRVENLAWPSLNANRARIYGKISRITLWAFDLRLGRGVSPNFQPRRVSLTIQL